MGFGKRSAGESVEYLKRIDPTKIHHMGFGKRAQRLTANDYWQEMGFNRR
jgi:hypothetical protein